MKKIIQTNIIKRPKVLLIASVLVVLALIAALALVFTGLYFVKQNTSASLVKEGLKKAALVVEVEKNKTGGYPTTIDGLLSVSNKVKLTGGGSFDGMSFCIAGTSTDESVLFHIDSLKSKSDILSGGCESGPKGSVPLMPSGLAIAFASSDSIKMTWNKSIYASGYTLQCSTVKEFNNPVTVEVTDAEGICAGLKPDTTYYYRVKATNSAGVSAWSAESQFKTNIK
ncbi:MAG: fibronectin type III domain-containing protein [Candidatus Saccharimonadales bacterium]